MRIIDQFIIMQNRRAMPITHADDILDVMNKKVNIRLQGNPNINVKMPASSNVPFVIILEINMYKIELIDKVE